MEQVQQHMRVTAAGFSGAVTIGFLENFMDIIPPVIREFKADFPDIVVIPVNGSVNKLFSGLKDKTMDILGVDVPLINVPVRSGRNLAMIVEIAARNWRLKNEGYPLVCYPGRFPGDAVRFCVPRFPSGSAVLCPSRRSPRALGLLLCVIASPDHLQRGFRFRLL